MTCKAITQSGSLSNTVFPGVLLHRLPSQGPPRPGDEVPEERLVRQGPGGQDQRHQGKPPEAEAGGVEFQLSPPALWRGGDLPLWPINC